MNCAKTQSLFSSYLDGAISGQQMQQVAAHLQECAECETNFAQWRSMQKVLETAGALKPPADLGLKLRLAISHEAARRQGHWFDPLSLLWDNQVRPALLQVSAGLASALVLVGSLTMLVGMVAAPPAVLANDEPLGALTTPHFLYSVTRLEPAISSLDSTVVIQADINEAGEVYNYTVLSGPTDVVTLSQVRDALMVQLYEPARVFGEPVRSHVLITFSGVSVRG